MAATLSTMVALGTSAPPFKLPDVVSGREISLNYAQGSVGTVIMFICNHCPYVKHINTGLVKLAIEYQNRGISFVAISSNDAEKYPEDGPEKMKAMALQLGYPFPYLYDESQEVARAYDAACTPDFFVYDKDLKLVYRGQFDDSRPSNQISVSGSDLRKTLKALLEGKSVPADQKASIGCNIKWNS
jgi:peroxiredoxin